MSKTEKRGHLEFHSSVKLTAELPTDKNMREHLDELKMNDGFQGSCTTVSPNALSSRKVDEADEWEPAVHNGLAR